MNHEKIETAKETNTFITNVERQLKQMSEVEKDEWILQQAKLVNQHKYKDFLMSLNGTKKIQYMPEMKSIQKMFTKIENEEIYLNYDSCYNEFDDYGNYCDNWEEYFEDPYNIMSFLDCMMQGSHDLIIVAEYQKAYDILDKVLHVEIDIIPSEDCGGYEGDDPFTIKSAYDKYLLDTNKKQVTIDYIYVYYLINKNLSTKELAKQIVDKLEFLSWTEVVLSDIFDYSKHQELFMIISSLSKNKKIEYDKKLKEVDEYSLEKYPISNKIEYYNKLIEDINNCIV